MRRSSLALCALVAGFAFVVVTRQHGVSGGVGPAGRTGDVNGDGSLDVSDAVYLLVHLFRGGPAPVACADNALAARVVSLEKSLAQLESIEADARLERVEMGLAELSSRVEAAEQRARDVVLYPGLFIKRWSRRPPPRREPQRRSEGLVASVWCKLPPFPHDRTIVEEPLE